MGTRRLRLYVVAYLRGLLKPYYVQGNLSVVREELILNALSAEMDSDAARQLHMLQASMAQNVKDKQGYYSKLFDKVLDFRYGLEFDGRERPKVNAAGEEVEQLTNDYEVNDLIHSFKKLKESGDMDAFEERANKEFAEEAKTRDKQAVNPFMFDDPNNPKLQWKFGETEEEKRQKEKDS